MCGNGDKEIGIWKDTHYESSVPVDVTFSHSASSATITISSTIDENANNGLFLFLYF